MGPFCDGWTEADVEAVIARGDPLELLYVPIVVGMGAADCERGWAEGICYRLAEHSHFNVRGNAVLGLGHIARTCRELNLENALPFISRALGDASEYVRDHASNAACDLDMYMDVVVPGYDTANTESLYEAIDEVRRKNAS